MKIQPAGSFTMQRQLSDAPVQAEEMKLDFGEIGQLHKELLNNQRERFKTDLVDSEENEEPETSIVRKISEQIDEVDTPYPLADDSWIERIDNF